MGNHIVLFQPEIPANTGNIARTCAATDTTLHLIHPLGFSIDEKAVRRAGLDYWSSVKLFEYESIEELFNKHETGIFYYIEDYGEKAYSSADLSNHDDDYFFIFGKETKGLPEELFSGKEEYCLRIPMTDKVRSLNLSNSAAIIVYEALRQQRFHGLT